MVRILTFALLIATLQACRTAPLTKRAGVDTTLRLGPPQPSGQESLGPKAFSSDLNTPHLHQDESLDPRPAPEDFASHHQQPSENVFRTFLPTELSLGHRHDLAPLRNDMVPPATSAMQAFRPQARPVPYPDIRLSAARPQGTPQNLEPTKFIKKPRTRKAVKPQPRLVAASSFAVPSAQKFGLVDAIRTDDQTGAASQLNQEESLTASTLWRKYSDKYLNQPLPRPTFQRVLFPQATADFQERIDALESIKKKLLAQRTEPDLTHSERRLILTPFKSWNLMIAGNQRASKGYQIQVDNRIVSAAERDSQHMLKLEALLKRLIDDMPRPILR